MVRIKPLFLLVPLALLAGCAGMSEQECFATDWRSVGFEDGVAGRTVGGIGNYRQACSRYGVAPDLDAYRTGHAEGVEVYCRPARGFEVGHRGSRYQGVCPADKEDAFVAAYNEGRHLYELESAVRAVGNQIAARHKRLDELKSSMGSVAAALISDETPLDERAGLVVDTANMAREQGDIEDEISALEAERLLREDELLAYQETLVYGQ